MSEDFPNAENLLRSAFTFSPELKERLGMQGKKIITLSGGKSIDSLEKKGLVRVSYLDAIPREVKKLQSIKREVAIVPSRIILPGSDNKTLDEQRALMEGLNKLDNGRYVMLGVADLLDLYARLETEGMFDQIPDNVCVRTLNTLKEDRSVTTYSFVVKRDGGKLAVDFWPDEGRYPNVAVAQVISPA